MEALAKLLKVERLKILGKHALDEQVHLARVQTKRLLAALRLVRPLISPAEYQRRRRLSKEAADLLAPARNQHVIRKRLLAVSGNLKHGLDQELKDWIQHEFSKSNRAEGRANLEKAIRALNQAMKNFPEPATECFAAERLQHSYYRARKAYKRARERGAEEEFHRWRQRAKTLFLQLQAASELHWIQAGKLLKKLDALQAKLGEVNDSAIAEAYISNRMKGSRRLLGKARKQLCQERLRGQRKALKCGRKLFESKRLRGIKVNRGK